MYFTVYKVTNTINGKIYVGVHKTNNLNDGYLGSGKVLRYALRKYGQENFKKEYIAVFGTSQEMFKCESMIVTKEFVLDGSTYNLKEGGTGGFDYINERSLNVRNITKENAVQLSQLANAVKREKYKDPILRQQYNEKISRALRGREGHFKGKKHTEEAKRKIGQNSSVFQKGTRNSQYNTYWIYSDTFKQHKKVKKDQLDDWLTNGWKRGRK